MIKDAKKNVNSSLSNEMIVGLKIYEYNSKNKLINFNALLEEFNGKFNRQEIGNLLDQLFDLGLISSNYHKGEINGQQIYYKAYNINKEAEEFFRRLYLEYNMRDSNGK